MIALPNTTRHRCINRVRVGTTDYWRLHYRDHGSRFGLLLDTLEEALIIRDGLSGSGEYFAEKWSVGDLQWLRDRLRSARLQRRKVERPESFKKGVSHASDRCRQ